jgi:tRNA (Thr-GGU) A37 N-methylase
VLAVELLRIKVSDLEALNGTPILDVKPVLAPLAER